MIAVLRLANQVDGRTRGKVEDVVKAVEVLSPEAVQALATRARTFDFFERIAAVGRRARALPPARRRRPSAPPTASPPSPATTQRDRLMVTALLHDVGKLVLMHAYPGYPAPGPRHGARTPEERIHRERRELGVDHALVGGVLARRWGLPKAVASAIERHHADDAEGEAAFVRLADMLAHYAQGARGRRRPSCSRPRARVGLGPGELRTVMYDLPYPAAGAPAPDRPVPALRPRGRGPQAPGRGQGLQADRARARRSRRARCARTCTTSTASSARSTAPRPCSSPPSAAGSKRPRGAAGGAPQRRTPR